MRTLKWLVSMALAWTVGSLPACGTMGGGGMKGYLAEPPPLSSTST